MGLDATGRVVVDDFVWELCDECGLSDRIPQHVAHDRGVDLPGGYTFVPSGVNRQPGESDWARLEFLLARDRWPT